ncbi:MAG TPA: N-acetylmuramoyl-L-alanine amidase [Candidatus Polarisedimenticolia bacterium]|nr:N-acetylmuramoyl-L-alanine amidase [Candidatus Polarisedimenticolia bacterium]
MLAATAAVAGPWAAGGARRAAVDDFSVATLEGANAIFLEVQAGPRDSYVSLAHRYCGSERHWAALEKANQGRGVAAGLFYAIPFEVLKREHQVRALTALFPADGPEEEGWVHRVPEGDDGQTLESVASWFAGDPMLAGQLAEANGTAAGPLAAGSEIVVPRAVLLPDFEQATAVAGALRPLTDPPAAPPSAPRVLPAPPPKARPAPPQKVGELTFVEDARGAFALYRLKPGEALYSSVIMKFTGRLDPAEVQEVARQVSALSGIKDFRSIPAGFAVKIPRELILPEYLPAGDARRAAYESGLAAAQRHAITVKARDLDGVTIILDSGHGGDDVGARRNGVHEDDYVYDILCRIKELAEKSTAARVMTTLRDASSGYKPQDGPFAIDRDEYLLTSPVYYPRQPHAGTAGVNLRWYLVNSYYRRLVARGADPQKIVFLSLHADSLHPSARGAMVYVPGQAFRERTFGHSGRLYDRREVGELRFVKFAPDERERSEGYSRRLASRLVGAFRAAGLPVHDDKPIRDRIIRMRRTYAPAVIRSSLVPQSVLLEVANLGNKQDALLLKSPAFRQKVAAAVLDALRRHYGSELPGSTVSASAARKR